MIYLLCPGYIYYALVSLCIFFFHNLLLLGLLVFAISFTLLTFSSLINKGVGRNLAH